MHCQACDAEFPLSGGERIGFAEVCDRCRADLHVCANCEHHDATAHNQCRESNAEHVADRERANRCEYFRPAESRRGGRGSARRAALDDLEALFKQ